MESFEMPTICVKCKNSLTKEEKEMGLPLCQDCIGSLTDNIMGKMRRSEAKKIGQEVDDFSRFISSSGNLFKLDDITIIQCSFNIFMRKTAELKDKNLTISQKILRDAIKFMERELENINDKKTRLGSIDEDNRSMDSSMSTENENLVSKIDKLIRKGMKSGNGADSKEDTEEDMESTDGDPEKIIKEDKKEEKYKEDNKNDKSSNKKIEID